MTCRLLAAAGLALMGAGWFSASGLAQDAGAHLAQVDRDVVIYTHRFLPEEFEKGRELVVNGFSDAIENSQQNRMTVFVENAENYEIVAVSFFGSEASVDEWHDFVGRLDVLESLEPLRREPMQLQKYEVIEVHRHE